ncbi:MAG: tetratricopeptide repeat protein [Chloroflexi bacterium]|nr:MAG: tetratricopeptide repeat protein [Chloroflexota bacterium]
MRRIKRDYSRPLFSKHKHNPGRSLFFFGLLIGGFLVFVITQFSTLQLVALDAVGMAPTPTPFASFHAQRGLDAYLQGDIETALAELRTAVELRPNNIDYIYEYGKLLLENGQSQEAFELGVRAVELYPDDPRGYALQARALQWDAPAEAIPIAVNGLEKDPNFAPLHAALSVAYTLIGRYQEALTRGALAVELDPYDPVTHRSYSVPLIFVGDRLAAIDQLEEALKINPNLTNIYFELAAQYRALDVDEMAVAIFQHVIEIEPDNAKAYLRMCETYSGVGLFAVAQDYCEEAINIDPEYAAAYRELGRMKYNRRNYEGAIEDFETCVALGSTEIECYYLRGLAHWILGQCDAAWTVLQESLGLVDNTPENEPVIRNIRIGLQNVTRDCPAYRSASLPTAVPPTPIPPTPIGGFG